MITITNLSKNFDQRLLLKDVSLGIFPNEKIGLTGPNGTGKTTLFSIILGELEPSAGTVQVQKNIRIGYLPQEAKFDSERTLIQELTSGDERMRGLIREKRQLEDENKADTERYGDVVHELELLGIYNLEHKAEKILSGLGFSQRDFQRPINHLSGGWRMRALLAKLLTYDYDLLLLDEPTNYLDLPATLWLKDFLSHYPGTFVIISHDKVFLNEVTNYTIILEDGRMTKAKGNYEQVEAEKENRLKFLEKKKKEVDKKRQQLERFAQRFHAQPNRAAAVRNKRKMIERLENIELPPERKSIKDFTFASPESSGYNVITLEHVQKSYGEIEVYKDINLEITRKQKVCLVGANGAGKSTLMKILAGIVDVDAGVRKLGYQVDVGYFSQTRLDVLHPERTAFDEVVSAAPAGMPAVQVRTLLGIFNFHGDDVFKQVKILSGGEKSRVILAKLLINPPNFILLDEPTTHLDIDGVEALTKAFKKYDGSLCFISHDLFFIREIANTIIEVDQGCLKVFPGRFQYYLDKKKEKEDSHKKEKQALKMQQNNEQVKKKKKEKINEAALRLHKQHREALKRLFDIKQVISHYKKEKSDLETESYVKARVLSQPFKTRDQQMLKEYGQRLKAIDKRIKEINKEIDKLIKERDNIQNT
ncbi:MAG: ABC-F family ATP-binding cassette domain-containing protein [Candidatus Omnitrophota bacterium]